MQFQPGQSGNPAGRPKGTKSGRMQALGQLDAILSYAFYANVNLRNLQLGTNITTIGDAAFYYSYLSSITLPSSVDSIGIFAFLDSDHLSAVYFEGNAPSLGSDAFSGTDNLSVYYHPEASGWSGTYGGRPAVEWAPIILADESDFGMQANQFGFSISGPTGAAVVVESSVELADSDWAPKTTNVFLDGSTYFSDTNTENSQFYRLRMP